MNQDKKGIDLARLFNLLTRKNIFLVGIIIGGLSWAICPLVSDKFEPFDTGLGYVLGQILMTSFTVYIGFNGGFRNLLVAVFGAYVGQNAYAFTFGSDETRAWFLLLMFTSLFLCVIPLLAGIVSMFISKYKTRYEK